MIEIPESGIDYYETIEALERALVTQALSRTNESIGPASRLLNLRRTTLWEILKRLGLRQKGGTRGN